MAIVNDFEYCKPKTVVEAVKVLGKFGARAQVLAGGTDLIALMADDVVKPGLVVDIKGIRDLDQVKFTNGKLNIGPLVTFAALRESAVVQKKFPVIREMTGWVASTGIRNRATMVGNICSAVPCCDSGPILLVYDALVNVRGNNGSRAVPIGDWFKGPRKTILKGHEMVVGLTVPLPREKHAACFVKLRRYKGEDLAQASVTVMALAGQRYRVAFGSVSPTPIRSRRIEALLKGRPLTNELVNYAMDMVPDEITPITDIRATREYRIHMVGLMLEKALRMAVARLNGKGLPYGTELL